MITNKTNSLTNSNFETGEVILIDKQAGVSSFYIVKVIRGITRVKKVGHAGTLDPNATGLLVVCTGKKTKEIWKYQDAQKTYSGTIYLGKRTESMDGESEVVEEKSIDGVTIDLVKNSTSSFIGEIEQIPPMYSALKHKGKPLYKYARKGIDIQRQPRTVNISKFIISEINLPRIKFTVDCSKGTYIRVLADDFARELGTVGFLESLRREKIGELNVSDAIGLQDFETLYNKE
jgi:tRNA pseudouridine55 synthase